MNSLALVTYHPEYHWYDPQRACASIAAATELGFGWVRLDIRWREILPEGTQPNPRALAWYQEFLRAASARGLKKMVVLSTPPDVMLRTSSQQRLDAWGRYVETVVNDLGVWCDAYQLMNEPNNPVYRFFSLPEAAGALVRGASLIHAANANKSVVVNISMEICGWREYLRRILELSGQSVNIIGIDHYPGTWTVGVHEHWDSVLSLADTIAIAQPSSPWYKRRLAIIETGFSTNAPLRDQGAQAHYFERLGEVVEELKHKSPQLLVGIYELCDADSATWLDPEAHFGLFTSDLRPKRASETVRRLIARFTLRGDIHGS